MALFGAPIAHEDHAQRACYAALRLQEELSGYADELRLKHGIGFSVRMGINSGEVVVGKIGDDLRMDYTACCTWKRSLDRAHRESLTLYLASEASSYVTGQVFLVDGSYAGISKRRWVSDLALLVLPASP